MKLLFAPSRLTLLVATITMGTAAAQTACESARLEIERQASSLGLAVVVRCRLPEPGRSEPRQAVAEPWPQWMHPRSGPLSWLVREVAAERTPSQPPRAQRVPLVVTWTGPAWVAVRDLLPGTAVQPEDFSLQQRRWPEGIEISTAAPGSPPSGRLRSRLNAGDMLLPAGLHPSGTVLRGDAVTVIAAEGAVEIRWPARMLVQGRVGQQGMAQGSGRSGPIQGRIVGPATLLLEGS